MAKRQVTIIEPTINPLTRLPIVAARRRRVAGYARVSTDHDEQFTSYEAQVDYYTNYIKSNPEWEFVKVYTDEGISGLSMKKRDGFNEMIEDALAGKIDLIVTKSVSRFARNTVDSLTTIRKLKDVGCECYFEKENIFTFDSKGELLLTIMSSLAQEESRSISENVTWGKRKGFSDGKICIGYKNFLGYTKGPDKEHPLVIVPEEAKIVRRIYSEFIFGKTAYTIADELTTEGVPTPAGRTNWQASTIESILTNEKYKGSALLQKFFTVDFLTKKMKPNEGEVPRYFIEQSHEAIIDPVEWELVQMEFNRRRSLQRRYSGTNIFGCRIVCADCGGYYGPKVWDSTDPYRKTVWQCNEKFKKGKPKCTTPHLLKEEIEDRFLDAFNRLVDCRKQLLADCAFILEKLTNTSEIEAELNETAAELSVVTELTRRLIEDNSKSSSDQDDFDRQYSEYVKRYETLQEKAARLQKKKAAREEEAKGISIFMGELKKRKQPVQVFDQYLWVTVIDHVLVRNDGTLVFHFRNGKEIEA